MTEIEVEKLARFLKAVGDERIGFRDWSVVSEVYTREARQVLDFLASGATSNAEGAPDAEHPSDPTSAVVMRVLKAVDGAWCVWRGVRKRDEAGNLAAIDWTMIGFNVEVAPAGPETVTDAESLLIDAESWLYHSATREERWAVAARIRAFVCARRGDDPWRDSQRKGSTTPTPTPTGRRDGSNG